MRISDGSSDVCSSDLFLDYVHDIDVSPVPPSPELDAALGRLPGRKLIFTNGSVRHAENVLNRLGVAHHFEELGRAPGRERVCQYVWLSVVGGSFKHK